MSNEVLRSWGEEVEVVVTQKVSQVRVEREESDGSLRLVVGDIEVATADKAARSGKCLVILRVPDRNYNDFYVSDESEAVDALEDIGRFYLAVKAGEV